MSERPEKILLSLRADILGLGCYQRDALAGIGWGCWDERSDGVLWDLAGSRESSATGWSLMDLQTLAGFVGKEPGDIED